MVTIKDVAEILVKVVTVTKEDDMIHNYQFPLDDCFAHLEVQFRFNKLSSDVDGVLGRTYRPDFENSAKPGVTMPMLRTHINPTSQGNTQFRVIAQDST
ncbi:hypothetical protein K1719_028417 [Acacia pycnantha]|nr:hypothetical protein K1719_028417 [Acacia pycnantha]